MKRILLVAGISALLGSSLAWSDEAPPADEKPAPPAFGQLTGDWLRLQLSGTAGSENPQVASAQQQEKAAKRFLDSYNHAIPEYFYTKDKFISTGK